MDRYRSLLYFIQTLNLFVIHCEYIQVYNTENALIVQSYDCIYYTNITAGNNETIPYCIRTNESISLDRSFASNSCQNFGT